MSSVAIIIPIYNMEKYLIGCLDSVSNQTLKNIEIICINDGSTDSSLSLLQQYQEKDKRVKIIDQKNAGVSAARNAGIDAASSEFVCFMDPDDSYPDSNVLETLYKGAKENQAKICGGSFSRYDERTNRIITEFDGFYEKYTFSKDGMISYKEYQYDYGYHRFIYSLKLLKENNILFPPYKRFQDPPFFVRAMLTAKEFYAIKRVVYQYRVGHQKINWNEERVMAFSKGICENLLLSSENNLENLHAVTVQRIIEQKKAIEAIKLETASDEYQRSLFEMLILIRKDLIEKSSYHVEIKKVFTILKNSLISIDKYKYDAEYWKTQYESIKSSKTFMVGSWMMWLPKKIRELLRNSKYA